MKTILWFVFVFLLVVSERLVGAYPTTENGTASQTTIQKRSPRAISFYHGVGKREIPFELDSSFSDKERCLVKSVLFNLMSISCIRFRAKTSTDTTKFMSISKFKQSTNSQKKNRENFVFLKANDSYNSIMQKVLKFLILRPNLKAINFSFRCSSPVKLSMDFVRTLVHHYRGCKSYFNITTDSRSSPKVEDNLVRNTRSATVYTETLIHGDILVRRKSSNRIFQDSAVGSITRFWPNSGEIPFVLDKPFIRQHKCLLKSAMLQIMLNTCIRYRARTTEDSFYFNITDSGQDKECRATVGFYGGLPDAGLTTLSTGCMYIGTVVHEFLHVIGFYHHQSRPDRDEHLYIVRENIDSNKLDNFEIVHSPEGQLVTRWDYNSVMLYGERSFGLDNRVTMKPKRDGVVLKEVYHKPGLSALDAVAINRLYKCKSSASTRLENNLYENGYFMNLFSELVDDDCQDQIGSHLYMFVD